MNRKMKKAATDLKKLLLSHKTLMIIAVALVFSSFGIVYAVGTINAGFRATNSPQVIDAHGTCKEVKTTSGSNIFVPTKTSAEWAAFRNNKPAGVTLGDCFASRCAASGGTVSNGYCKFNFDGCPSGWTPSVYTDTGFDLWTGNVISCDRPSGVAGGGSCSVSPQFFTVGSPASCFYNQPIATYGSWTTSEYRCSYKCSYKYECGGYPYQCGLQNVCGNVCGFENVTNWGQTCFSSINVEKTASVTARYCY